MALDTSKDVINNPEAALLDYLYRPTVIVVVVVQARRGLLQPDNRSSSS